METKQQMRDVFLKQPAYFIFLDATFPMDDSTFNDICDVLANVTALIAGIKGSPRVSALGVYYLAENATCVFPLQQLRLNFAKLNAYLECLKNEISVFNVDGPCSSEILSDCLKDAIDQYEKHFQTSKPEDRPLMQVIMLSAQPVHTLTTIAEEAVTKCNFSCLRKFQVFSLPVRNAVVDTTKPGRCGHAKETKPAEAKSPPSGAADEGHEEEDSCGDSSATSGSDVAKGLVCVLRIRNNLYQLEMLLKTMLHDYTTEVDHVRIVFKGGELTLRCDVHERMLNPHCFYGGTRFTVTCDASSTSLVTANQARFGAAKVPVYTLEAVGTFPSAGVCESILYGNPVLIGPTACWKYDWDELKSNRICFRAVSKHLKDRKLVLVIRSVDQSPPGAQGGSQPRGFFVVIPNCTGTSMLIKSVASAELLIPLFHTFTMTDNAPFDENASKMVGAIDALESQDVLNPLQLSSGLYDHLTDILRKIRAPSKASVKAWTNQMKARKPDSANGEQRFGPAVPGPSGTAAKRRSGESAATRRNRDGFGGRKGGLCKGKDFAPTFIKATDILAKKN